MNMDLLTALVPHAQVAKHHLVDKPFVPHVPLAATIALLQMEHRSAQAAQLIMAIQMELVLYAQPGKHLLEETVHVQSVV